MVGQYRTCGSKKGRAVVNNGGPVTSSSPFRWGATEQLETTPRPEGTGRSPHLYPLSTCPAKSSR
eukprot:3029770-Rhodomonas_salina.1